MIVNVRMSAFLDGRIRAVEIPDGVEPYKLLKAVYYYGQNHVCPADLPSVSPGDVIEFVSEFGTDLWLVMACGFRRIDEEEYKEHLNKPNEERILRAYGI